MLLTSLGRWVVDSKEGVAELRMTSQRGAIPLLAQIVPIQATVPYRFAAFSVAGGIPTRATVEAGSLITLDFSRQTMANQLPPAYEGISYLG